MLLKNTKYKLIITALALAVLSTSNVYAAKKKKKPAPPPPPTLGSTKDYGVKPFDYDPSIFDMQLGTTTFEQADKVVQREGGIINAYNYGEVNAQIDTLNAHEDKANVLVNKEIVLADFVGVPLDHLLKGRMGFYKDKLYFLYYEFEPSMSFDKLEMQVLAKYGKPHKIGGFPDRFLEWKFLSSTLALKDNFTGADRMVFTHNKLLDLANKSNKTIVKEEKNSAYKQQRAF